MEVPETFRGMKKVKEYTNHVLYEKIITDKWGREHTIKECATYYDLGFTTKQIRDRKINASMHL
nr:MAG TPA: hypothetical protein [Caudoviricetes sp.]